MTLKRVLVGTALIGLMSVAPAHAAPTAPFNPNPQQKRPIQPVQPVQPLQPAPSRPSGTPPPVTPASLGPCPETVEIAGLSPFEIETVLTRGDHKPNGHGFLNVQARVRTTKRRVFIEGTMIVVERLVNPFQAQGGQVRSTGDTRFQGAFQVVREVPMPAHCEIASVTPHSGHIGADRNDGGWHTVYGSGVFDSASCRTNGNGDIEMKCRDVRLQRITVRTRPLNRTCGTLTVGLPSWSMLLRNLVEGDGDMGGNRPFVEIDAEVSNNGDDASLRLSTRIRESQSDWTTMVRNEVIELIDVSRDAPGCQIQSITPSVGRLRGQTRRANNHKASLYGFANGPNDGPPAEGLIGQAYCRTDSAGDDRGRIGCGEILIRPITIQLRDR